MSPGDGAGVGGVFDHVGIIMSKSVEGDAVADVMRAVEGVEVIEAPTFWDVRAKHRLTIPYEAVSDEVGYAIDGYSLQHEMSTHYGRLVMTEEALMLFSDPLEAMDHLM